MPIEKLLRDLKVLQEGHFLLNSGLHSRFYFEKFRILENPLATTKLCAIIAEEFRNKNLQWVIGPTTGGIIIAFEVARQLRINSGFAEEVGNKRIVRRGFRIKGKRVLVVDDVLTTGKSLRETIQAVKEKSAEVVGIAVLIDRSTKPQVRCFSTYRKLVENYQPEDCPLCRQGIPLTKLGGV
jgi:orotate phosphoribosyltransferase